MRSLRVVAAVVCFFATSFRVSGAGTRTVQGPTTPIPPTLFGMTIHRLQKGTPFPSLPIGSLRTWDVMTWGQLNPARGVYNWDRMDTLLQIYDQNGVKDVLFTFGKIPSWASANPAADCGGLGRPPARITSISRKAGTITIVTASDHNRIAGDPVAIRGVSVPDMNGEFAVDSNLGPKSFTIRQAGRDAQADGGTVIGYGGCAAGIARPDDVLPFARAFVKRYCGKVRNYEMWNEPNYGHFLEPGSLASLDRQLYSIIKDPSNCSCSGNQCGPRVSGDNPNTVVAPAVGIFPQQLDWIHRYASAGGGEASDVASFHGYGFNHAPEHLLPNIARLREEIGVGDTSPVWDTEGSWGKDSDLPKERRPGWITKFYIMHWLSRVSRFYWYAYDNSRLGTLWSPEHGLTPAGVAYRETSKWLVGAVLRECLFSDDHVSCYFSRPSIPGYSGHISWSLTSQPLRYKVPDGFVQYRTLDGRTHSISSGQTVLITEPVLLENRRLQ